LNTGFSRLSRLRWEGKVSKLGSMPQNLISPSPSNKSKLLDQVRDVIRRKHFSIRTERTYCDWIRRFILYHGKRHPQEMAEPELTDFLTHLARDGRVAASTQNQARKSFAHVPRQLDDFRCIMFMCCAH